MKFTIEIKEEEFEDLDSGLREILRKVLELYIFGFDKNETGRYSFEIKEKNLE